MEIAGFGLLETSGVHPTRLFSRLCSLLEDSIAIGCRALCLNRLRSEALSRSYKSRSKPLNVEVILPVEMLDNVKKGMRAKVIPEKPMNAVYTAEVTIIDRVVDAASGTFGVRLELPNPDYRITAGLKCRVIFQKK